MADVLAERLVLLNCKYTYGITPTQATELARLQKVIDTWLEPSDLATIATITEYERENR